MAAYVTDRALFKCAQGIMFRCKDSGQGTVSYSGSNVLTMKASLGVLNSPPLPCPLLTAMAQGVPTNMRHLSDTQHVLKGRQIAPVSNCAQQTAKFHIRLLP